MGIEKGDELDRLLDEALSSYTWREPRPGIEQRVLNGIGSARPAPGGAFRWWAVAAGATLCIAGLVTASRRESASVPSNPAPRAVRPAVVRPTDVLFVRSKLVRSKPVPLKRPLSASPLTREERALLSLLDDAPDQAREALSEWRPGEITLVSIEAISIPPLQSDGGQ